MLEERHDHGVRQCRDIGAGLGRLDDVNRVTDAGRSRADRSLAKNSGVEEADQPFIDLTEEQLDRLYRHTSSL